MAPKAKTQDQFRQFLKLRGLSLTKERREILEVALGMPRHFSVDDLYFAMRQAGQRPSKATLYRTVQLLAESRILRESALSGRQASYEIEESGQYHVHMICEHCGKMSELSGPTIEKFVRDISGEEHFLPLGAQIKLTGVCDACIRENPPSLRREVCVPFLKYAQSREG